MPHNSVQTQNKPSTIFPVQESVPGQVGAHKPPSAEVFVSEAMKGSFLPAFCNKASCYSSSSKMAPRERTLPTPTPGTRHPNPEERPPENGSRIGRTRTCLSVLLEHKRRPAFLCLCWAMARTSSHQNDHPAPGFPCGHPNRWKGTSRYRETGSLKSIPEPISPSLSQRPTQNLLSATGRTQNPLTLRVQSREHTHEYHLLVPSSGSKLPVLYQVLLLLFP